MRNTRWDDLFMEMSHLLATQTTCVGRPDGVGAVLVRDKNAISSGFNGVPSGIPHPTVCKRRELNIPSGEQLDFCNDVHAEANAIVLAAKNGIITKGSTLYSTHLPCLQCCMLIINAGITEVVYEQDYADHRGLELLRWVGINIVNYTQGEI